VLAVDRARGADRASGVAHRATLSRGRLDRPLGMRIRMGCLFG